MNTVTLHAASSREENSGKPIYINPDTITAFYKRYDNKATVIVFGANGTLEVTEEPESIQALLKNSDTI